MSPIVPIVLKGLAVGLGGALVSALIIVALFYLFRPTVRPRARQEADVTVLEYSRAFKIVSVFFGIACGLFLLFILLRTPQRPPLVGEVAMGFLMFVSLREFTHVIRYNQDGLDGMESLAAAAFRAVECASVRRFGTRVWLSPLHGQLR